MPYVHTLPDSLSFRAQGLCGYTFGPLGQTDLEVLYIESEKGHDTFMVCKGIARIYYVLAGSGYFTIEGREYGISPGVLVEIPPGVEFSYSGCLTMLAFCRKRGFRRKDTFTRWNPDVVGPEVPRSLDAGPWFRRVIELKIFGKSPTGAFLRLNKRFWNLLPSSLESLSPFYWYGRLVHALARIHRVRAQAFFTVFFRNRPELELIQRVVRAKKRSDTLKVAVLGCSAGAEVYSIASTIRAARPELRLALQAVDISKEAVEFAKRGIYPVNVRTGEKQLLDCMAAGRWRVSEPGSELVGAETLDRMTSVEKSELLDIEGDVATVKDSIKDGISWHIGDARAPEILDTLGLQDIVVANNFLCHMEDSEAERCLRNIARLVAPQGYLFVSGIDLDVRERVAKDLAWEPVEDLLEEIHDGDPCLRNLWPCEYAGLEPLNKRRRDWRIRYAAAFHRAWEPSVPEGMNTKSVKNGHEFEPASRP